jgi:hypothetical protein
MRHVDIGFVCYHHHEPHHCTPYITPFSIFISLSFFNFGVPTVLLSSDHHALSLLISSTKYLQSIQKQSLTVSFFRNFAGLAINMPVTTRKRYAPTEENETSKASNPPVKKQKTARSTTTPEEAKKDVRPTRKTRNTAKSKAKVSDPKPKPKPTPKAEVAPKSNAAASKQTGRKTLIPMPPTGGRVSKNVNAPITTAAAIQGVKRSTRSNPNVVLTFLQDEPKRRKIANPSSNKKTGSMLASGIGSSRKGKTLTKLVKPRKPVEVAPIPHPPPSPPSTPPASIKKPQVLKQISRATPPASLPKKRKNDEKATSLVKKIRTKEPEIEHQAVNPVPDYEESKLSPVKTAATNEAEIENENLKPSAKAEEPELSPVKIAPTNPVPTSHPVISHTDSTAEAVTVSIEPIPVQEPVRPRRRPTRLANAPVRSTSQTSNPIISAGIKSADSTKSDHSARTSSASQGGVGMFGRILESVEHRTESRDDRAWEQAQVVADAWAAHVKTQQSLHGPNSVNTGGATSALSEMNPAVFQTQAIELNPKNSLVEKGLPAGGRQAKIVDLFDESSYDRAAAEAEAKREFFEAEQIYERETTPTPLAESFPGKMTRYADDPVDEMEVGDDEAGEDEPEIEGYESFIEESKFEEDQGIGALTNGDGDYDNNVKNSKIEEEHYALEDEDDHSLAQAAHFSATKAERVGASNHSFPTTKTNAAKDEFEEDHKSIDWRNAKFTSSTDDRNLPSISINISIPPASLLQQKSHQRVLDDYATSRGDTQEYTAEEFDSLFDDDGSNEQMN